MQTLLCEHDQGVATVTLNRPQARNALDTTMADELAALFAELRGDASVRAVVLAGAGGAFCAGGDVREMAQAGPRSVAQRRAGMARYARLARAMLGLEQPLIAAVDGVAYGAGFSLALMADIVLVGERARLSMAFQRVGLIPDVAALYTLPRVLGVQRAKELVYSAREIDAQEAVRLGLALEVLPGAELLPRAQAMAHAFTGASPVAMALAKRGLSMSLTSDLDTLLDFEATGQAVAADDPYVREAIRRFAAKEPPQFRWPPAPAP